jgi:hypothetical protein
VVKQTFCLCFATTSCANVQIDSIISLQSSVFHSFFLPQVRVSSIPTSSPRRGALTRCPERACWVRSCKNASYYELFTGFSPCEQSSIYGLRILSCHGRQDNFPNGTLIFARLSNEISPRHRVNQCLLEWMLEAGRGRPTSGSTMIRRVALVEELRDASGAKNNLRKSSPPLRRH